MKRNIFLAVVLGLICLMITVAFATTFTHTYDTATPVGTDAPSVLDNSDRNIQDSLQERLNVEHVFDKTGTEVSGADTGQHTGINCTSITNTGNAAHTGTLSSTGNFAVNTDKFTVAAATGNTLVAGTLTATGVATVAKGSLLASSDAPTTDAMIVNKKYVDDTYLTGQSVQVVNTQTGTSATGTTLIPDDNTIPQKTEGTQFMTLAITPKSATNKLKIEVVFFGSTNINRPMIVALFQDGTANALVAISSAYNYSDTVSFTYFMTAGTISETTFKVRAGSSLTETCRFNGSTSGARFGGVAASSITITEIKV